MKIAIYKSVIDDELVWFIREDVDPRDINFIYKLNPKTKAIDDIFINTYSVLPNPPVGCKKITLDNKTIKKLEMSKCEIVPVHRQVDNRVVNGEIVIEGKKGITSYGGYDGTGL